jgi:hypothetical protein
MSAKRLYADSHREGSWRDSAAKRAHRRAQAARYAALAVKLTGDEAIALCRAEKAKRVGKPNPDVLACQRVYDRQRAEEAAARKGLNGRPRKGPRLNMESRDPADVFVESIPPWGTL